MKFIFSLLDIIACNYFYLNFDAQKGRVTEFLKKSTKVLFKNFFKKIKKNKKIKKIKK